MSRTKNQKNMPKTTPKITSETEIGFALAGAMLSFLIFAAAVSFLWLMFYLLSQTAPLAVFLSEFSLR